MLRVIFIKEAHLIKSGLNNLIGWYSIKIRKKFAKNSIAFISGGRHLHSAT